MSAIWEVSRHESQNRQALSRECIDGLYGDPGIRVSRDDERAVLRGLRWFGGLSRLWCCWLRKEISAGQLRRQSHLGSGRMRRKHFEGTMGPKRSARSRLW